MKTSDFKSIQTKKVNLKDDISELQNRFSSISKIYLFGSRAYKTNSTRSDIDLIIVADKQIPTSDLQVFRETHKYLDLFVGDNSSVLSIANGACIRKRGLKSLIKQLDAVLLWSKKHGFANECYLEQFVFEAQQFFDSAMPYPKQFISLKSKLNNPLLSPECQFYFQESLVDFVNECFLSSVAMFGLACECMIDDLSCKCTNKYQADEPSKTWRHEYSNDSDTAKSKLLGLEKYFVDYKRDFRGYGFTELDISIRAFDVVRNYRNNADHPLGYTFTYDDCCLMFMAMSIHIDKILNLIDYLNTSGF